MSTKPVAGAVAAAGETVYKLLGKTDSPPPITRFAVWVSGLECTLDDSKARDELGYVPVITREQGLTDLSAEPS